PQDVALPPIWLLGSSGYSAQLAAMVGAGFSFAHHFAEHDAVAAMLSYRDRFKPSPARATPYAILACAAVCADSDAEAERLAATESAGARRPPPPHLPPSRAGGPGRVPAAGDPAGGRRLSFFAGGARPDRAQSRPPVRRREGDGAGAAARDDRRHQGRRSDG